MTSLPDAKASGPLVSQAQQWGPSTPLTLQGPLCPGRGAGREQVTWRNPLGSSVSSISAWRRPRSSCWASVSLVISSAWRTSEAVTRSLPRWTNSETGIK